MNLLVENIIPMQVILLLFAAAILPLVSKRGWLISFIAVYICAFISCLMIFVVKKFGYVNYVFGKFSVPYGIEFRFDPLSSAFAALVTIGSLPIFIYSFLGVKLEIEKKKRPTFYALMLINLAGSLGVIIAHDLFTVYVFIEISSISAYGLVAAGKSRESAFNAYNYLIIGTIGASFYLLGIGIIFAVTGSLNMQDVARLLSTSAASNLLGISYICVLLGILLKIGIFPFHSWMPGVLYSAPSPVSALFSVASTNVMIYLIMRLFLDIFNTDIANFASIQKLLMIMAFITVIAGGVLAMMQKEFRKLLAYSSLMNYSLIIFAISIATKASIAAALVMTFAHSIVKSGLFMSAGLMSVRRPNLIIEEMPGTFAKSPWTTAAFVINVIALSGIPPFINFLGKWQLLVAAFKENKSFVTIGILATLFGLLYSLKIIDKILFKPEPASGLVANSSQILMECGIILTGLLILIMTCFGGVCFDQAQQIAAFILGKI